MIKTMWQHINPAGDKYSHPGGQVLRILGQWFLSGLGMWAEVLFLVSFGKLLEGQVAKNFTLNNVIGSVIPGDLCW